MNNSLIPDVENAEEVKLHLIPCYIEYDGHARVNI
jgi:hypothetical protein